mgnify:CR=1 FL=1
MELTELQKHKKHWIDKAVKGLCTNRQCAMELNLCVGHIKVLKRRYKEEGDSVFIHGNTGRQPKHTMPESDLKRIIEIKESVNQSGKKIFDKVNFTQFTTILNDFYGIDYSRNTISNKLKEAGYVSPKKRKSKKEETLHEIRPARPRFGELLQGDGTSFDWFENGKMNCIHVLIDDATDIPVAMYMVKNECAFGYYEIVRQMLLKYGIPEAFYLDGLRLFFSDKKTDIEETEKDSLTQFAQTMEFSFGIEMIRAYSPQAKGRVERFNQTIQSDLPVYFKLYNINTVEEANSFLPLYCKIYARKFGREPKESETAFVPLNENQKMDLAKLLSVKVERTTDSGCSFSLNNYIFIAHGAPKQKIEIHLSVQDGIWGITKTGKRVEIELFDDDECNPHMPQVWKDLINKYFFEDAKAKYRAPYKEAI